MSPQRALPEPLRAVLRRLPTGPGDYGTIQQYLATELDSAAAADAP